MTQRTNQQEGEGVSTIKLGDIVLNGYASPGFNDLHIVVGSTSRKTGPFSTTQYYECRMLLNGKLRKEKSLFNKSDNKLVKIGHYDLDKAIRLEMEKARERVGS